MYLTLKLCLITSVLGSLVHNVCSQEMDDYSHAVKMLHLRYGATLRWDTSSWSEFSVMGYRWPEWEKNPPKIYPKFNEVSVERQIIDQPFFQYLELLKDLETLRFRDCQFSSELNFEDWAWPPVKSICFINEKIVPKIPIAFWKSLEKSNVEGIDYRISSTRILPFIVKIPRIQRLKMLLRDERMLQQLYPLREQTTRLNLKITSKISPESFRSLQDFTNLQTLLIDGPITLEHLQMLKDLPIQNLALTRTLLQDSDLEIFASWKSVKILYLPIETPYPHNNHRLTKNGLSFLLKLPEKTIDYRGSFLPF